MYCGISFHIWVRRKLVFNSRQGWFVIFVFDEKYIVDHFNDAINKGHIKAYFQPVYRALTEDICSVEALARWDDPELGLISPQLFIDVLEKHKLIYRLDLYMLKKICELYRKMAEKGMKIAPFSINLSRLDFNEPDLFELFTEVINAYDVPHGLIRVEITESVMLDESSNFRDIFNCFHDEGFSIWMDDFGSGYSSLNVLKDYNFDVLKLDMLFLRNFGYRSMKMISAIVNMAKAMEIHTLAEGIETREQLDFLRSIGCELIQGYYYAKPMTEDAFLEYMQKDGVNVELSEEEDYWNTIGKFNFLSTNPLEDFHGEDDKELKMRSDIPLALAEYFDGLIKFKFYNHEFRKKILQIGYESVEKMEDIFNEKVSSQYIMFNERFIRAVSTGKIQKLDYVTKDIYYTIKIKAIAKTGKKNMLAMTLFTFDSDKEERSFDEILRASQSLFSTYEHVTLIYPEEDMSKRIYSIAGFDKDYSKVPLRRGFINFCNDNIYPDDQKRYMQFVDMETLEDRLSKHDNIFVQKLFRVKVEDDYRWRTIRITRIPGPISEPTSFIYTIQKVSNHDSGSYGLLLNEHPDIFDD